MAVKTQKHGKVILLLLFFALHANCIVIPIPGWYHTSTTT